MNKLLLQYAGVSSLCFGLAGMYNWGDWAAIGAGLFILGLLLLGDARWGK